MVVIIFPVKFSDNIVNSELVMRWDYDWTYGFAWGAFIFSAGAAVFFLLPNGDKEDNNHSYSEGNSKDTTP